FRNLAKLRHRLTGENLNLQPNLKLTFVRPDFAHLRPGMTIDHCGNIKAACLREKPFVRLTPCFKRSVRWRRNILNRFSGFRVIQRVKPLKRSWVGAYFDTLAKARR